MQSFINAIQEMHTVSKVDPAVDTSTPETLTIYVDNWYRGIVYTIGASENQMSMAMVTATSSGNVSWHEIFKGTQVDYSLPVDTTLKNRLIISNKRPGASMDVYAMEFGSGLANSELIPMIPYNSL